MWLTSLSNDNTVDQPVEFVGSFSHVRVVCSCEGSYVTNCGFVCRDMLEANSFLGRFR